VSSALSIEFKITSFVADSSRSYANCVFSGLISVSLLLTNPPIQPPNSRLRNSVFWLSAPFTPLPIPHSPHPNQQTVAVNL